MSKRLGLIKVMWMQTRSISLPREGREAFQEGPYGLGTEGCVRVGIREGDTPGTELHSVNKGEHLILCDGGGEETAE